VTYELDRRTFLRRGALGAAGVAFLGSPLLAACSSDNKTATTTGSSGAGAAFGSLDFQLSWIKNVEFGGEYLADTNGYYSKLGFSAVNLISGGPNVAQDSVVASGSAIIGISSPDITASAVNNGADLVVIGAQYQKNPFAIISLASSPINTPQDMIGKKIGVQATNEAIWAAFLKANNIDESRLTKVPVQFDPQPLVTKDIDGYMAFITNEPNLLKTRGVDTANFLLNDFGYPLVSESYMVSKDSITKNREKIKAILKADIQGWHDSLKDPAAAPNLVVSKYGKDLGLDVAEQTLESKAQNALILTDDTKANGLFTITDSLVDKSIATMKLGGIDITKDKLFDLSLIKEVYAENPDLKTSPS
jgi:ABC-type nitrate/sulfonate/bicarbonate transport system substrate-binding protein